MRNYIFLWAGSVLISEGIYDKVAQAEWLKPTNLFSHDSGIQKSHIRSWRDCAPHPKPLRETPSSSLPALGGSWHRLAYGCLSVFCLCLHMGFFSVHVSLCTVLIRTPVTLGFRIRVGPKSRMILSGEPERSAKAVFLSSCPEWCELWGTPFILHSHYK